MVTGPGRLHNRAATQLAWVSHWRAARSATRRRVASVQASTGPVVVIDNYDSFTYNLCQYLGDLGCEPLVLKNDERSVQQIRELQPAGVLVSPGPGTPDESGISLQSVRELGGELPVFGVCMGHQCIGQVYGGRVVRAPCGVMHGKSSPVFHTGVGVLEGLPNPFQAARYHSLVIERDSCPAELEVTAWTEDGTIMGVRHRQLPHVQGVQFHPESIITKNGHLIIRNFLASIGAAPQPLPLPADSQSSRDVDAASGSLQELRHSVVAL